MLILYKNIAMVSGFKYKAKTLLNKIVFNERLPRDY